MRCFAVHAPALGSVVSGCRYVVPAHHIAHRRGFGPRPKIFHVERNLFRLGDAACCHTSHGARRGSEVDEQAIRSNIPPPLAVPALRALLGVALYALVAAAPLGFSVVSRAAKSFDDQSFKQAQAAGKPILVDVTASWCPTCRQQRPIVEQIEKEKPNLVVYKVDFDTAKDTLKRFRGQHQSTLIVFKGTNEVGRSTGDTDPARIRALVAQGF